MQESDTSNRLYGEQLALSERHLDSLLDDTNSALNLLATLSESFKAVESQTTAFQAQCEDLLAAQRRLRDLADEVGTDLQYYAYLEPLTRRLNAPGAGRLIRSEDFLDMVKNLNTCIDFMDQHVSSILLPNFTPISGAISHALIIHNAFARFLLYESSDFTHQPLVLHVL